MVLQDLQDPRDPQVSKESKDHRVLLVPQDQPVFLGPPAPQDPPVQSVRQVQLDPRDRRVQLVSKESKGLLV